MLLSLIQIQFYLYPEYNFWVTGSLYFMCEKERNIVLNRVQLTWSYELWPSRLFSPWDSLGKKTGVGCHFFLQGENQGKSQSFPNQELNPDLHNCRQLLYQLSYARSHYVRKSIHNFLYVKYRGFVFHFRKSIPKYERYRILYFMLKTIHSNILVWNMENFIPHQDIMLYEIEKSICSCRKIDVSFLKCYI